MRMIGTVLVDEKNMVRREPADNLLSQYYQTEMQITNVDQVSSPTASLRVCVCVGARMCLLCSQNPKLEGPGQWTVSWQHTP